MSHLFIKADARRSPLADGSVHCVVTSPPYFALRDYGVAGQIGLESSPEAYVAEMVKVYREVWRVLRDDGTLWLNIGDSWNAYNGNRNPGPTTLEGRPQAAMPDLPKGYGLTVKTLKAKDLIGIPWMLAFALRADGWYLRQEIIWSKTSGMPESVRDRPGRAHEHIFLLTKRPRYFYDADAVRTKLSPKSLSHRGGGVCGKVGNQDAVGKVASGNWGGTPRIANPDGAIVRSVWPFSSGGYKGSHFATMPAKLAERCIRLGTSEKGCCPRCGSPWVRVVERTRKPTRPGIDSKCLPKSDGDFGTADAVGWNRPNVIGNRDPKRHVTLVKTVGWESSCTCLEPNPAPCTVFDPFGGVATTVAVADALGRHGIMTELSGEYLTLAKQRLERPHAIRPPATKNEPPLPLFPRRRAN